mmetsp:Transcript_10333/g.18075  ORF Transcript_10333/g.18075 Transcript_10333/m.18075 type:complete len:277 (+) Transcript_10333:50-880(+)|eukprot:CAMPEP_0196657836 /NCGR_PEP_ID=MMETSP1086-20130531/25982_1 /TAXON_ID=77921 /ORGANISM="Cyanoptyche  gloeocystis , Strain SAG4.97" /LENGTH=276 /DNA_ID=CAMNT_0041991139 /DNA_START=49 /DNA_END=879 /DNA_ORIENTATION=+
MLSFVGASISNIEASPLRRNCIGDARNFCVSQFGHRVERLYDLNLHNASQAVVHRKTSFFGSIEKIQFTASDSSVGSGSAVFQSPTCIQTGQRPQEGAWRANIPEDAPKADIELASERDADYTKLKDLLAKGDFRAADAETRHLLCVIAGEKSRGRKWLYMDEYADLPATDLRTIDRLWVHYSNGHFGYSVQHQIFNELSQTLGKFFIKVGWKFDRDVQGNITKGIYRFRRWPQEFDYTLQAPKGHLPLTNHLRGKAGHMKLLCHPAWSTDDQQKS